MFLTLLMYFLYTLLAIILYLSMFFMSNAFIVALPLFMLICIKAGSLKTLQSFSRFVLIFLVDILLMEMFRYEKIYAFFASFYLARPLCWAGIIVALICLYRIFQRHRSNKNANHSFPFWHPKLFVIICFIFFMRLLIPSREIYNVQNAEKLSILSRNTIKELSENPIDAASDAIRITDHIPSDYFVYATHDAVYFIQSKDNESLLPPHIFKRMGYVIYLNSSYLQDNTDPFLSKHLEDIDLDWLYKNIYSFKIYNTNDTMLDLATTENS